MKTIREIHKAREEILDAIDDVIDGLSTTPLRDLLLAELLDSIGLRASDIEGYYGKPRTKRKKAK